MPRTVPAAPARRCGYRPLTYSLLTAPIREPGVGEPALGNRAIPSTTDAQRPGESTPTHLSLSTDDRPVKISSASRLVALVTHMRSGNPRPRITGAARARVAPSPGDRTRGLRAADRPGRAWPAS